MDLNQEDEHNEFDITTNVERAELTCKPHAGRVLAIGRNVAG